MKNPPSLENPFAAIEQVMQTLRDPQDGCPWDVQQTHESISSALIEEAYETYQALLDFDENKKQTIDNLKEELGDLLFQVVFHSQLAKEKKLFTLADVSQGIAEKLIRRHPHVFYTEEQLLSTKNTADETHANNDNLKETMDAQTTLKNWEQIKRFEKENKKQGFQSMLSGLPQHLPALQKAQRIGQKVARVQFDWSQDAKGAKQVFAKVQEELKEFVNELPNEPKDFDIKPAEKNSDAALKKQKAEMELGDVFFSLAQLARHYHLDAEKALYNANQKFSERFISMEQQVHERLLQGDFPSEQEWEILWQKAKKDV